MPQEFVDAINKAVKEANPNAMQMVRGSMTLGSDFDEWLGPESMLKYGFGPMPDEVVKAFQDKFEETKPKLLEQLVKSAVEIEKQRMAGTLKNHSLGDSRREDPLA